MSNFGCVMVVPILEQVRILQQYGQRLIQESQLHLDPADPSFGRSKPHITALYGIREMGQTEHVKRVFKQFSPFEVRLTNLSCFYCEKYDVVKLDVQSSELLWLNHCLHEAFPDHEDTFGCYHPHLTLAYVKSGLGAQIVRGKQFEMACSIERVEYYQPDDSVERFPI